MNPDAPAHWDDLRNELDLWARNDAPATFWWRDDDAASVTPSLQKLLELSQHHCVPLTVATVSAHVDTDLVARILRYPLVTIAQHGHAHVDLSDASRAGSGELRSDQVGTGEILDRLERGRERLHALFSERFEPVVVPPWNRIDEPIRARLAESGFKAVSTFGPRDAFEPYPALRQINAHCDIIDWKSAPRFRGAAKCLDDLLEHLQGRRLERFDRNEPTGILTHHLDHDAACWVFLDELFGLLQAHAGSVFLDAAELWQ